MRQSKRCYHFTIDTFRQMLVLLMIELMLFINNISRSALHFCKTIRRKKCLKNACDIRKTIDEFQFAQTNIMHDVVVYLIFHNQHKRNREQFKTFCRISFNNRRFVQIAIYVWDLEHKNIICDDCIVQIIIDVSEASCRYVDFVVFDYMKHDLHHLAKDIDFQNLDSRDRERIFILDFKFVLDCLSDSIWSFECEHHAFESR